MLAALFAVLTLTPSHFDSILFEDGRFYEVPRITEEPDGLLVHYKNGEILVPYELLEEYFALEESGDYKPKNPEEEAKAARGLVPFEGRWVPKARRTRTIAERNRKREQAVRDLKEHQLWRNRFKESTKHFNFEYTVPPDMDSRLEGALADAVRQLGTLRATDPEARVRWGMRRVLGTTPRGAIDPIRAHDAVRARLGAS